MEEKIQIFDKVYEMNNEDQIPTSDTNFLKIGHSITKVKVNPKLRFVPVRIGEVFSLVCKSILFFTPLKLFYLSLI